MFQDKNKLLRIKLLTGKHNFLYYSLLCRKSIHLGFEKKNQKNARDFQDDLHPVTNLDKLATNKKKVTPRIFSDVMRHDTVHANVLGNYCSL